MDHSQNVKHFIYRSVTAVAVAKSESLGCRGQAVESTFRIDSSSAQNTQRRAREDKEVKRQAEIANIFDIPLAPGVEICRVSLQHLAPPCDSWLHGETLREALERLTALPLY